MGSRILGNIGLGFLSAFATIAMGMFIYNSALSTIEDSMYEMTTQEIQTFNNEFTEFEGKQAGSNINAMIGTLIANADTYRDEPVKIPGVRFYKVNNSKDVGKSEMIAKVPTASDPTEYIQKLNKIRNLVEPKHVYLVTIIYQDNGLVDSIIVSYDSENEIEDADVTPMH